MARNVYFDPKSELITVQVPSRWYVKSSSEDIGGAWLDMSADYINASAVVRCAMNYGVMRFASDKDGGNIGLDKKRKKFDAAFDKLAKGEIARRNPAPKTLDEFVEQVVREKVKASIKKRDDADKFDDAAIERLVEHYVDNCPDSWAEVATARHAAALAQRVAETAEDAVDIEAAMADILGDPDGEPDAETFSDELAEDENA